MPLNGVNIGIDVARRTLDIAVHETRLHWTISYVAGDFGEVVAQISALNPGRVRT